MWVKNEGNTNLIVMGNEEREREREIEREI